MRAFADSSALVKLYADEPERQTVRTLEQIIVAQLARVEVPSALWRKQCLGELTAEHAALLVAGFEADWFGTEDGPRGFEIVRMSALIVEDAARLTGTHKLRAYAAVQLASARAVRVADPDFTGFLTFDKALRDAAAEDGFTVW